MCGRIACLLDSNAVCRAASASLPNNQQPSYKETRQTFYPSANIMPSRTCYVLFEDDGQLVVQPMLWGLIPPWAEKSTSHGLSTNNARIETIKTSKLYSRLLNKNRCIVLVQGFYEWKSVNAAKNQPKQPYFIYQRDHKAAAGDARSIKKETKQETGKSEQADKKRSPKKESAVKVKEEEPPKDEAEEDTGVLRIQWSRPTNWDGKRWRGPRLLLMAGLYDIWKKGEEEETYSFTVITMASNNTLNWLHDRMPGILETQEQCEKWLDCSNGIDEVLKPATTLQHYPVDIKVNNSRCRDEDAMDPVKETESKPKGEAAFMQGWLKRKADPEVKVKAEEDEKPKKSK